MNHYIKRQQTNRKQSLFRECFEKKRLPAVTVMEKTSQVLSAAGITDSNFSCCDLQILDSLDSAGPKLDCKLQSHRHQLLNNTKGFRDF